jgi:6-phosphogluconolactonase
MQISIGEDPEAAAQGAADLVAETLREAVATRGLATLALSGGRTPARMLERLAEQALPWSEVHLFQTDERMVSPDAAARNAHSIRRLLTERVALPPQQVHWMPVEAGDAESACLAYQAELRSVAGSPPVLDLVHLGLGEDGHTASLFPGDPSASRRERDVVTTQEHAGWRRMTLSAPVLENARRLLWLVCGAGKARALAALRRADPGVPSGRLPQQRAWLFADRAAAAQPSASR